MRIWSWKRLLLGAAVCISIMEGCALMDAHAILAERAAALDAESATAPTEEQTKAIETWHKRLTDFIPPRDAIDEEVKAHLAGFVANVRARWEAGGSFRMWSTSNALFDISGSMLLGMALFRLGFLTQQVRRRWYWLLAIGGFAIVGIDGLVVCRLFERGGFLPTPQYIHVNSLSDDFTRVLGGIALMGALLLWMRPGRFGMKLLEQVGRMALSNYVFYSLLYCVAFEGWGFGLFARYDRTQLHIISTLFVVPASLLFTHFWMRSFSVGPFEWLLRSLVYWKRQPMRIRSHVG
jgi:uncharacterized protein